MYKYDNHELINRVSAGYDRVIDSYKMCDNRQSNYKREPVTLEQIEKYNTYNEGVHTLYNARVEQIHARQQQKLEANTTMERLAYNSGLGIGDKLYPQVGSDDYKKLGYELSKNPLLKMDYQRMSSMYPPTTKQQMQSKSLLQSEQFAEYGTTDPTQFERIKKERDLQKTELETKQKEDEAQAKLARIPKFPSGSEKPFVEAKKKLKTNPINVVSNETRIREAIPYMPEEKEEIHVEDERVARNQAQSRAPFHGKEEIGFGRPKKNKGGNLATLLCKKANNTASTTVQAGAGVKKAKAKKTLAEKKQAKIKRIEKLLKQKKK